MEYVEDLRIDGYEYARTSRTLCPDNNYYLPHNAFMLKNNPNDAIVSLSTTSPYNLTFSLRVNQEEDFVLNLSEKKNITISPCEPRYYSFKFPESVETVLLRVDSADDICMTVSIQNMSIKGKVEPDESEQMTMLKEESFSIMEECEIKDEDFERNCKNRDSEQLHPTSVIEVLQQNPVNTKSLVHRDSKKIKLFILKEIEARMEILFGATSASIKKEDKAGMWKEIFNIGRSHGAFSLKDWQYVRDIWWPNHRKTALGKDKATLNEVDSRVLEILRKKSMLPTSDNVSSSCALEILRKKTTASELSAVNEVTSSKGSTVNEAASESSCGSKGASVWSSNVVEEDSSRNSTVIEVATSRNSVVGVDSSRSDTLNEVDYSRNSTVSEIDCSRNSNVNEVNSSRMSIVNEVNPRSCSKNKLPSSEKSTINENKDTGTRRNHDGDDIARLKKKKLKLEIENLTLANRKLSLELFEMERRLGVTVDQEGPIVVLEPAVLLYNGNGK